ncbi:MAG: holin [Abditibacteriota bacterium]|nr:holin [Abditibacteriota bacterium]
MVDITPILQAVIALCTTVVTAYAIPWIKAKAGQAKTERLYNAAKIAVRAAEQIYREGEGKEKMKYVMEHLNKHGFRLSPEELRNSLEAAVLELNAEIY